MKRFFGLLENIVSIPLHSAVRIHHINTFKKDFQCQCTYICMCSHHVCLGVPETRDIIRGTGGGVIGGGEQSSMGSRN